MKLVVSGALAAALAFAALPAAAVTWSFTGPGTATVGGSGDTTTFTYNDDASYGGAFGTYPWGSDISWTATATADFTGQYVFDWTYTGMHSWASARASLVTFGGIGPVTLVDQAVYDNFSISGTALVFDVTAGDTFGFTITGSNNDSSAIIMGTLSITEPSAVPVPAAAVLLLSGLGALGATRRRRA